MKQSLIFLALSMLLSTAAMAAVQDQVCQQITAQKYSFSPQVACTVTIDSAYYFDQDAAGICLTMVGSDHPADGLNVIHCLQAISNKNYDTTSLQSCEALETQGDNAGAAQCLNNAGTVVPKS